jgi:putative proteasome-type protease
MTYCVGLKMDRGLVFMSDTRTNAGVDSIATFRKMFTWQKPGERAIVLLTAGNLATTQAVVSMLDERSKAPGERAPSILETPSMFQTARLVGDTVREIIATSAPAGQEADAFGASIKLGGQIRGTEPRLFLIYPEGNFVEASGDTPFFQIGEVKYGKPIIIRAYDPAMSFAEAAKLLMVSLDSTLAFSENTYLVKEDTYAKEKGSIYVVVDDKVTYQLDDEEIQPWVEVLRRIDGKKTLQTLLAEAQVSEGVIRKYLEEAMDYKVIKVL